MCPLERAARALCATAGNPEDVKLDGRPLWQDYLPAVRAVLQAIREPSKAMLVAAMKDYPVKEGGIIPCDVRDSFVAMIDAALKGE